MGERTPPKGENMADLLADYERELVAKANTPEALAEEERAAERRRVRAIEEHAKGVRLGWWDEEGNPLNAESEEPDEDEEEESE